MNFFDTIFKHPALFHYLRLPIYLGTTQRLAAALALENGERLLDVGCGTGTLARLTSSRYVGIDTCLSYLQFSRRRVADPRFSFVSMSGFECAFADQAFDKAVVVNMVHHLDESAVDRLLVQLARIVKKRVVLMDADPGIANPLERFLLRHDRGDYIRQRPRLRALISQHFDIADEYSCHNTLHITPQVIFTLVPRARVQSAVS